jgi:hypothetical protein
MRSEASDDTTILLFSSRRGSGFLANLSFLISTG